MSDLGQFGHHGQDPDIGQDSNRGQTGEVGQGGPGGQTGQAGQGGEVRPGRPDRSGWSGRPDR